MPQALTRRAKQHGIQEFSRKKSFLSLSQKKVLWKGVMKWAVSPLKAVTGSALGASYAVQAYISQECARSHVFVRYDSMIL